MQEISRKQQMTDIPFEYYARRFAEMDPQEIAARTGLSVDAPSAVFSLRLLGREYRITHPNFGVEFSPDGYAPPTPYEKILLIRYLTEGRYKIPTGRWFAYAEMPWGDVYRTQFQGRVLARLARVFGSSQETLARALRAQGLDWHSLPDTSADAAYELEFLTGLYLRVLLWAGDEEFPPSVQILFGDNFPDAFTAEDMAVCGDSLLRRLSAAKESLCPAPDETEAM